MNTTIEEIRKRITAAIDYRDEAGDYDEYGSGQSVGLATALQIIDEVEKEQSATAMNYDEIKSCQELYNDIDSCIEALIKARTEHNQEDEGKALFRMEGLMVAALQQLTYFIDKPVPSDVEEAAEMAARRKYPYEGGTKGAICEAKIPIYREGFIAGAEWQRKKPVPEDVQDAADQYIGYPHEVDEDSATSGKRQAFADGMLAERWRVNRKAEVPEDYDPEYDKEALEAADEYVKGALNYGAFRLMRPAFADGWMAHKERLMKEAVEREIVKDISGKLGVTAKVNLDGFKFGEKVKIIILK